MSFNRIRANNLVSRIEACCDNWQALSNCFKNAAKNTNKSWRKVMVKLQRFADCRGSIEAFKVFVKGNSKLPFFSFSTLPVSTCPGAGDCKNWCYSLKAWRYPSAFARQVANTLLMRFNRSIIIEQFNKLPDNITLRLYVDGDFESSEQVNFWFNLLKTRSSISAYGYSKSWDEVFQACQIMGELPKNYRLNLSSGGLIRSVSKNMMETLSITRGSFIAVKIDPSLMTKTRFALPQYHDAVRQAGKELTGKAVFSCPGKCGECDIKGKQACGNTFAPANGLTIAIGIH